MPHNNRVRPFLGTVLLAAVVGCTQTPPPDEPPPPPPIPRFALDHFLCYQGGGETVTETFELEDQFDRLAHQRDKVTLQAPIAFCNPVAKTPVRAPYKGKGEGESEPKPEKGKIQNKAHHLVAYRFETETDRAWNAQFFNQITPGGGRLAFRRAQFLLVPSQKVAPRKHPEPEGLDHFKCYLVDDPPPSPGRFDLDDQFEGILAGVELTGARAICAPVDKYREGKKPEPARSDVHLVCYGVQRPAKAAVSYNNQFERPGAMTLNQIFGLCVPSRKEGVRRGGGPEG